MNPAAPPDLVHTPLARWAAERPTTPAIEDGATVLDFAALHAAVQQAAAALDRARAPATVLIDDHQPTVRRVVDFLAAIATGRCAAVSDPDWTADTRQAVRAALDTTPATPPPPGPTTPFYIGFTSGSTGAPKGFRRHHQSWTESFRVCLDTFGPPAGARILVPGRFSHSLFLFGILLGLWSGAGVVLQERFSATRLIDTLARGLTPCLVAVPSQLLVVLELAQRRGVAPMEGVQLILISGARWMRERTPALQALFPRARIVEFYGASETSFIAWMEADAAAPAQQVGQPFANVEVQVRDPSPVDGTGLIFVRSPMVFMDYAGGGGDDTTSAIRDGDWLSVRDMGRLDARGRLHLMGRQNRMVVTQGKNLFPEELETVLAQCPGVAAASVHGLAHPVRGQQVVAVVRPRPGATLSAAALASACRARLEAYKVPRRFFCCDDWPHTASGKTDHHALGQRLARLDEGTACLQALP